MSDKERLALWLEFGKWVGGTFLIGAATIAVNWIIKTRELELARVEQDSARELAELEQQRVFLESFVAQAMEQDVRVRLRLAHYIKTTTLNEDIRATWETYYRDAFNECVRIFSGSRGSQVDVIEAECRFGGAERIAPAAATTSPLKLMDSLERLRSSPKPLALEDIETASEALGIEPATFHAYLVVETRGSGFIPGTDLPSILFERHWFARFTEGKFSTEYPDISNGSPGGYHSGRAEWDRLIEAAALNEEAALRSTSWGLTGIMGFNFEAAGYPDVWSFVEAQFTTEGQLDTAIAFLKSNSGMVEAFRDKDWAGFAKRYNGPNFRKNQYDTRLAEAYATFDPSKYPTRCNGDRC